jgi:hypothetical protein
MPSIEGPPAKTREGDVTPASLRAQLLATEHWSLLATRSMVQSEILTRITTFLMLVSSSIVGLALIGQITRFDTRFQVLALVLTAVLLIIGTMTQMRVGNAALEDLGHVVGMNRLRAGYVALDPGLERYLVTSAHDDSQGVWQTYNHLEEPSMLRNLLASGGTFITFITSGLAAAFGALLAILVGLVPIAVGLIAAGFGLGFLLTAAFAGRRKYGRIKRSVLFPGTGGSD